jgi:hypothetical protein
LKKLILFIVLNLGVIFGAYCLFLFLNNNYNIDSSLYIALTGIFITNFWYIVNIYRDSRKFQILLKPLLKIKISMDYIQEINRNRLFILFANIGKEPASNINFNFQYDLTSKKIAKYYDLKNSGFFIKKEGEKSFILKEAEYLKKENKINKGYLLSKEEGKINFPNLIERLFSEYEKGREDEKESFVSIYLEINYEDILKNKYYQYYKIDLDNFSFFEEYLDNENRTLYYNFNTNQINKNQFKRATKNFNKNIENLIFKKE